MGEGPARRRAAPRAGDTRLIWRKPAICWAHEAPPPGKWSFGGGVASPVLPGVGGSRGPEVPHRPGPGTQAACSADNRASGPGRPQPRLSPANRGCPGSVLLTCLPGAPKAGSLRAPRSRGHTTRPFTPGVSGGAGGLPGVLGWPLALPVTASGLEAQGTVTCNYRQGNFSDVTPTFVLLLPPVGDRLGASVCPHAPKRGAMTPIKRWPPDHQDGECGGRAGSPLSLDTLPGSPAARQAQRETVATKNNPSSV